MLILKRRIDADAFVAIAEIGIPSKREDVSAVLALAKESSGYVKPEDVNQKLLGRPAESPHGERILMEVESFGLLEKVGSRQDDPYRMTDAGWESLGKSEVMIPEEGGYIFYTSTDPLLKESILKIERSDSIEKGEIQGFFGNRKEQSAKDSKGGSIERPSYLGRYARGYVFRQTAKSNQPVQVNSISEKVARSDKHLSVEVALELEMNAPPRIEVKGSESSSIPQVYCETPFNLEYTEVLKTICTDAGRLEVLEGEPTLLVDWGSVKRGEAERFSKVVEIAKPTLPRFGIFQQLSIELPILPATKSDALQWGNHLIRGSIMTYVDEQAYQRIRTETAEKFGRKFDPDSLAKGLMDFDSAIQASVQEKAGGAISELFWYLMAPKDLSSG